MRLKSEEIIGIAEVRDVFRSPRYGSVAGCMVSEGSFIETGRLEYYGIMWLFLRARIFKRFKDDVSEVRNGIECGIGVRNYNDVKVGDLIRFWK